MASPRDLPAWLRAILNLIAIIGVAATLLGSVQKDLGVLILIAAPIYVSWEIWPFAVQFTRRYAPLSLVVFIFIGGCLGAGIWWAIRLLPKPPGDASVKQINSGPTPRSPVPPTAVPSESSRVHIPNSKKNIKTYTPTDPVGTLSALGWTIKRDSGLLTFEAANKPLPSIVESATYFAQLHESFRLHLQNVPSLQGLDTLWSNDKCREIELSASDLTSISQLSGFKSLQKLTILQTPLNLHTNLDGSSLEGLTNLTTLNLYGTRISDLTIIRNMTALNSLTIGSTLIKDLSPIRSLKKLKILNIRDSQVIDISPASTNTSLEELEIGSNQVNNLGALASLQHLRKLTVIGQTTNDLSLIGSLTHLTDLFVWGPLFMDLAFLKKLPNLTNLQISGLDAFTGQRSRVVGIDSICSSRNLKVLALGTLDISTIDFIGRCDGLSEISLGYMPITSLSGLSNMQSIKKISLIDVPLTEISPLLTLPNLESLSLIRVPARADVVAILERKGVLVQNP